MAQLSYSYQTPKGVAGSLFDISPYAVESRVNGETDDSVMKFGMGAVQGAAPGSNVKVPAATDTVDKFEGLILTGFTSEMNMSGEVRIYPLQTVGILRWGRGWARIVSGLTVTYGDALYLVNTGADAGLFTNDDGGGANLAVKGRFIGALGTGDIAPIELYNQKAE